MADYDERTALLVVDIQNDFADPKGSLYVAGGEDVVPVANDAIEAALAGGASVFYTQDWHPGSTPHFKKDGGIWPVHCVKGTWGAEFHPGLHVKGEVVQKGTGGEDGYSGFTVQEPDSGEQHPTALETLLRDRNIERVVVAGLATDYCVRETALDALRKGFETVVLGDATRPVELDEGDGERAFEDIRRSGGVIE
ncbi:MAG: isochorismatase family protein [Actinomycetota bacterium]